MTAQEPALYAEPWRSEAACASPDVDASIFFPEKRDRIVDARRKVSLAKAVCATCPVQPDCLAWAIETHEHYGILGGKTPTERRKGRMLRSGSWGRCLVCGDGVEAKGRIYCSPGCRSAAQRARDAAALAAVRAERPPRAPLRASEPTP